MSDKKLYAAASYSRHGHRSIQATSHSVKALRRNYPGLKIFALESGKIAGKEIREMLAIVGVANIGPAKPAFVARGETRKLLVRRYSKRYRRQLKREKAA